MAIDPIDKIRNAYDEDFRIGVRDATDDRIIFFDDHDLRSQAAFEDRLRDELGDARMDRFTAYGARVEKVAEEDFTPKLYNSMHSDNVAGAAIPLTGGDSNYCLVRVPSEDINSLTEMIDNVREQLSSDKVQEYLREYDLDESDLFDESRLNQAAIDQISQEEYLRHVGLHEGTHCEVFHDMEALENLAEQLDVRRESVKEIVEQASDLSTAKKAVAEYLADRVSYIDAIGSGKDHVVEAFDSHREATLYDEEHPPHGQDEIDRLKQSKADPADHTSGDTTQAGHNPADSNTPPPLRDSFSGAAGGAHLHHDHSHGFSIPEGHVYGNEVPPGELANVVEEPPIAASGDPALLEAGGAAPQTPAAAPETAPEVAQPQPVRADMASP